MFGLVSLASVSYVLLIKIKKPITARTQQHAISAASVVVLFPHGKTNKQTLLCSTRSAIFSETGSVENEIENLREICVQILKIPKY